MEEQEQQGADSPTSNGDGDQSPIWSPVEKKVKVKGRRGRKKKIQGDRSNNNEDGEAGPSTSSKNTGSKEWIRAKPGGRRGRRPPGMGGFGRQQPTNTSQQKHYFDLNDFYPSEDLLPEDLVGYESVERFDSAAAFAEYERAKAAPVKTSTSPAKPSNTLGLGMGVGTYTINIPQFLQIAPQIIEVTLPQKTEVLDAVPQETEEFQQETTEVFQQETTEEFQQETTEEFQLQQETEEFQVQSQPEEPPQVIVKIEHRSQMM